MSKADGQSPASARVQLLALALIATAAVGLWVHRIHVDEPGSHHHLLQSDTFNYFHPSAVFLHHELREGRLPLWNPYQMAGQPYLALHMPGVLYPPNLVLAAVLPPVQVLEAHSILHMFLAGLFMWLLAGRLGLGTAARLAAAAAYMGSVPLLLGVYMTAYMSTPAWLPAILWAVHGLLQERTGRWAVSLAACLAMAFLGGHAQAVVYQVQIAGLFGLAGLVFVARREGLLRIVLLAAASGVLALGFAAPQLLPALELAQQAVRGFDGVPYELASFSYITPNALLSGLLRPFGPEAAARPPGIMASEVVLPAFAILLMACGLLDRRLRFPAIFFGVVAFVVALLMLGSRGPLFETYYSLPLSRLFRNPARWDFVYAMSTALLMALGIEALSRRAETWLPGRRLAVYVGFALALAISADVYSRTALVHAHPASVGVKDGLDPELIEHLRSRPGDGRVFLQNFGPYNRGSLYKAGMMNGIFVVPDYEPSMPAVYAHYFGVATTPPWQGRLDVVPDGSGVDRFRVDPRRLDLMSVRGYAIRKPPPPETREGLAGLSRRPPRSFRTMELFERREALPRAYVVRDVTRVPDLESALRRLDEDSFRPRHEAVLEDASEVSTEAPAARVGTRPALDRARIVRDESTEVVVEASCGDRCLLVLSDLHYPGWRVSVDGEERRMERVNGIFRGVELAPGDHVVTYRYQPMSFRAGVVGFFLALLAGVLLWRRA